MRTVNFYTFFLKLDQIYINLTSDKAKLNYDLELRTK